MTGYTERTISLKTLWQRGWSKYKPFLTQYAEKCQLDGCIKFTKKYLWSVVNQYKNSPWVRYLNAADVRYHLDCWLVRACLTGAIVTPITTSLVCCKCNRQHRWLYTAITNMNAGLMQVYQTCMLVGTNLQTWLLVMQLLKAWEMAGCNCYRHTWWSGANVIYMILIRWNCNRHTCW